MVKTDVGNMAGEVWKFLAKNGQTAVSDLPRKINNGRNSDLVQQAVGWLARENKVDFSKGKNETSVFLAESEQKISKQNYTQQECR